MIEVQIMASSSRGNCYRIKSGSSQLFIEAGMPLAQIKRGINYELGCIDGCLISHEHMDHAQAAAKLQQAGVELYMSRGTAKALKIDGANYLQDGVRITVGDFTVLPFKTQHDAAEPLGFYISDGEDNLLFATDTYYISKIFPNVTLLMLECNYDLPTLKTNMASGKMTSVQARRLLRSHFSLEHLCVYMRAIDLSAVRRIWLLHRSALNLDRKRAVDEIKAVTGKAVKMCGE